MEQSASWWHFWSLQRTHLKVLTSSPIRDLLWFTSTTGIKMEANVTNTWTTSTLKESVNKSPMLSRRGKPSREWWMEQDEEPWGVNWSLDLWVGLKSSVGASPDELTALGGGADSYNEVDVLCHSSCCNIMLFVPHQHSVMLQDVTLLSSALLLLGQIFNL